LGPFELTKTLDTLHIVSLIIKEVLLWQRAILYGSPPY
jgi:hypothetical protein